MRKVAEESFRVLKPNKLCAILIGDTRKYKHYIPIAFRVMEAFLDAGFILKEDIIKLQWNMKTTREKWRAKGYEFYLIGHEHIFVFRKPENEKEYKKYKFSVKWSGNENFKELKGFMTFKSKGEEVILISVIEVNDNFILAIYKGKKGPADILVRYRQKLKNGKW